jgi:hypothetical protein
MCYLGAAKRIPDHYILQRWSKPPLDIVVPVDEHVQAQVTRKKMYRHDMRMMRYGNLCSEFAKLAVEFAASDKSKDIAEKHMKSMVSELSLTKKAAAYAMKKRKKGKSVAGSDPIGDVLENASMEHEDAEKEAKLAKNRKAQDPPVTTTKGRPVSKRKKGALQLTKPKPRASKCAVCNDPSHDAKNCPVRLANPQKYHLFSLFQ